MAESNQPIELYYMGFLRCARCSCEFEYDNSSYHPITLSMCGHTMCRGCIGSIRNQTECPRDHVSFGVNHVPIDQLPTNYSLLTIVHPPSRVSIEINC